MKVREDILGRTPEVGDIVNFNPPYWKGLVFGEVTGFAKSGLPIVAIDDEFKELYISNYDVDPATKKRLYTPKTKFAVIKRWNSNKND